ncbi:cation:dicarboxylase symporter family transporter [Streptomyces sp. Edi4]|uniref:cation:dicarboxylate symporter family transporter n=1 Tax=Streptomyces sp. Edi4 TaxID=3162527 RepID=UPI003305ACB3
MRVNGLRLLPFLRHIKEEPLIVLGTSSSEPVLPRMMAKLEHVGASKPVVGIAMLPAGYSFNLDGTAIYLTMGSVFLAQALGIDLSLTQQLSMLAIMLLTSKGAAGVTGSGFVALAATLSAVPHVPVAALALIFGIDRFMSEARAWTTWSATASPLWRRPNGRDSSTRTVPRPSSAAISADLRSRGRPHPRSAGRSRTRCSGPAEADPKAAAGADRDPAPAVG